MRIFFYKILINDSGKYIFRSKFIHHLSKIIEPAFLIKKKGNRLCAKFSNFKIMFNLF